MATFYVFAPWLVEAALPAAWQTTTPAALVEARRRGTATALRGLLGEPDVAEALGIARAVCEGLTPQGRPLYAAHAGLDWPEDDLLAQAVAAVTRALTLRAYHVRQAHELMDRLQPPLTVSHRHRRRGS